MNRTALEAAGMNVDEVLKRVLNNEQLFERLLGAYRDDTSCADLARALAAGSVADARAAAHALKGVSLNLSCAPLVTGATHMLERLHAGDLAGARALMPTLEHAQEKLIQALEA